MVYISDLQELANIWLSRTYNPTQPASYKDALNDCAYELNRLIEKSLTEEADYQEMLEELNVDSYLSSMEAHEVA